MRLVYVFSLICGLFLNMPRSFADDAADQGESIAIVSMYQLLANPEAFDGKRVTVIGVFSFDLELASLYPSQEYYRSDIFPSSIAVELPKSVTPGELEAISAMTGSYARVTGVFTEKIRGHSGLLVGTIRKTERIDKWMVGGDRSQTRNSQ